MSNEFTIDAVFFEKVTQWKARIKFQDTIVWQSNTYSTEKAARDAAEAHLTDSISDLFAGTISADHGSLSGLGDDDHSIYHTDARHDAHDHSTALGSAVASDLSDIDTGSPNTGDVFRWSGALWVPAALAHGDLSSVGEDDHHNRQHALNSASDHSGTLDDAQIPSGIARDSEVTSAISTHAGNTDAHHNQQHQLTGSDHTESGLTTGHVVRASGAAAFGFAAIQDGDLPATIARDSEVTSAISTHAGNTDAHHTEDHVSRHATGGGDALSPLDIGAPFKPIIGVDVLTDKGSVGTTEVDWDTALSITDPNIGNVAVFAFVLGRVGGASTNLNSLTSIDIDLGSGATSGEVVESMVTNSGAPANAPVHAMHFREGTPTGDISIVARAATNTGTVVYTDGTIFYMVIAVD